MIFAWNGVCCGACQMEVFFILHFLRLCLLTGILLKGQASPLVEKPPRRQHLFSCINDSVMSQALWPHGARQAPLSMGFSRREHWSGVPFPSPGDPPDPGIGLKSPELQAHSSPPEPPGKSQWGLPNGDFLFLTFLLLVIIGVLLRRQVFFFCNSGETRQKPHYQMIKVTISNGASRHVSRCDAPST